VPKDLLRLTTERLLWHGVGLDIISLSKAPLHTVPLFSFRSQEPNLLASEAERDGTKDGTAFQDAGSTSIADLPDDQRTPLYFDPPQSSSKFTEKALFYHAPSFIFTSFFGFQIDKPYRIDRFMPRARCYQLSAQGAGEPIPIAIPLLPSIKDMEKAELAWGYMSEQEKRTARRNRYDGIAVGAKVGLDDIISWNTQSGTSGTNTGGAASIERSDSETDLRIPPRRRIVETTPRIISVNLPAEVNSDERGRRETTVSEAQRSSTRSRTPMGRPRAASIAPSVKTISSRAPTTYTKSATPALISRLTSQANVMAPTIAPTPVRSSSWLAMFRGTSTKATPAAVITTPSIIVQRSAARASIPTIDFDITPVASVTHPSTMMTSHPPLAPSSQSSSSITSRAPTQPISIGSKIIPTREADRTIPQQTSSLISLAKFAPVEEVNNEENLNTLFELKLNPSKLAKNASAGLADQNRRWSSIFIRHSNDQQSVNWTSICTPATLPITTDYLPTVEALASLYTDYRYSISTESVTSVSLFILSGRKDQLTDVS
jgi:hypothetical protein